tara:strand:- start:541 stop:963 length:423 start_codon:yes stop_codon:yes gene_type:complete
MAGYDKIYCIGGQGGFLGSDGINPINLQILVGHGNRMWLEPHYFDKNLSPIGKIKTIIPSNPNDPNMLIDAALAFVPKYFSHCKMLEIISPKLNNSDRLEFDNPKTIPDEWLYLRKEAYPIYQKLNIYEAQLNLVDLNEN